MAAQDKLILDYVFEHAETNPDRVYLTCLLYTSRCV